MSQQPTIAPTSTAFAPVRSCSSLATIFSRAGFPGGYVGVDIFFVISRFLITGILLQELEQRDFSISRFYTRRIRRIFPAWVTILAASLIAGWALNAAYRYYMSTRRPFSDPPSPCVRAVQRDRTAAAFATARQSKPALAANASRLGGHRRPR